MKLKLGLALALPLFASAAHSSALGNRCEAMDDMHLPSEAIPSGVNGAPYRYTWIKGGKVGLGDEPGRFRSILPWSVIMDLPQNTLQEARIDIRGIRLSVRSRRTGAWEEILYGGQVAGGIFSRDLGKNLRLEMLTISQNENSWQIVAKRNHTTHFWPKSGRRPIEPDDIGGLVVSFEARMNPDDYRSGARFVMNAAADYWLDNKAEWDRYRTNGDAGIGRLKLLMPYWRTYNMTTLTIDGADSCQ